VEKDILGKLHMDVVLPAANQVYIVMQTEGAKIRVFVLANVLPKLEWPSLEFVQSVWQCYEENGGEEEAKRAMFAASAASAWNKSQGKPEKDHPAVKIHYAYNELEYFLGTFAIVRKGLSSGTLSEPSVGLIVREKSDNMAGLILSQEGSFVSFDASKEMPHVLDYYESLRGDGASWFRNHDRLEMAFYKAFNCTITIGLDKFRVDMETSTNHMASQAQAKVIPAT
jgi:hypothetical protein